MAGTIPLSRAVSRIKPADEITAEGEHTELKRSMGLLALTMFSVGSIVGTGIFVILGTAVPLAGPAVMLSFVLAAITCAFSAFSYAELAGSIPVSGSSYSYAYATLGELIAWICGWCLMLEYGVSVAAVAVGWGQYLNEFLMTFNVAIPPQFANPPGDYGAACPSDFDPSTWVGAVPDACVKGIFNFPAVLVVVMCAFLLLRGASESATVNTIMVFIKIGILLFFCAIAFTTFEPGNFTPFVPLGFAGVSLAAGQVFFSYIGFDAASTAGEEAKNAKRDLPRAIILSLIIVTLLYVLVAAAAIGAMPWQDFEGTGGEAVLASIARDVTGSSWAPALIALGAIISIFSVVLVVMYGQTRILFAMGRDGLLPKLFTKVNPKTQTPVNNTIIVTVVICLMAAFVPLDELAEATSIGTLAAFAIVNFGVIALWRARPELSRSFKVPLMPLMPVLGVIFCIYLITSLRAITWIVFGAWMVLGLLVYFLYSAKHSTAPDTRPVPLADEHAAERLRDRSLQAGTIVGVVLILFTSIAAVYVGLTMEGLTIVKQVVWLAVAVLGVIGAIKALIWLGRDRTAARQAVAGQYAEAAQNMRGAILSIAIWLLIPGLLAVFAVRFAVPPGVGQDPNAAGVAVTEVQAQDRAIPGP